MKAYKPEGFLRTPAKQAQSIENKHITGSVESAPEALLAQSSMLSFHGALPLFQSPSLTSLALAPLTVGIQQLRQLMTVCLAPA
jgi:hypothetical protein